MAGIAGLAKSDSFNEVTYMLDRMAHRGRIRRKIIEAGGTTMGAVWHETEHDTICESAEMSLVRDIAGAGHHAAVTAGDGMFSFTRDELGVAPLYTGTCSDGTTCFASEVKALIPGVTEIREVPPGDGDEGLTFAKEPAPAAVIDAGDPALMAEELRRLLDDTVSSSVRSEDTGSWLSGGLDSAAITAMASPYLGRLKTFTAGFEGSPDLEYAAITAEHLRTEHHEIVVTIDDVVSVLPEVIWHLESFDPLLVRSSVLNFIVAGVASDHVREILSGEGADELFAGYSYLRHIPVENLHDELKRITGKLHNTALQRVDRCASAHGTIAHLVFTDPHVVRYAMSVPSRYKIVDGVEKWILRRAVEGLLPGEIAWRPKAKFWEGGGVSDRMSEMADRIISDRDFRNERILPNGWVLSGREELWYYRIFRELFGNDITLSWIGRTDREPAEADEAGKNG